MFSRSVRAERASSNGVGVAEAPCEKTRIPDLTRLTASAALTARSRDKGRGCKVERNLSTSEATLKRVARGLDGAIHVPQIVS